MTDFGSIARKLAPRRVTFAQPRAPTQDWLDKVSPYPTISFICWIGLLAAGTLGVFAAVCFLGWALRSS